MSRFFINRPIVAIVISILTVIVGAITVVSLPVSLFPPIAPPEVQISTTYVGADAQTVEASVATPIEQQTSGVDNMRYTGGAASYLEVLDSDSRKFVAQLNLAQAQLNELESMVRIYRALGGGWHE